MSFSYLTLSQKFKEGSGLNRPMETVLLVLAPPHKKQEGPLPPPPPPPHPSPPAAAVNQTRQLMRCRSQVVCLPLCTPTAASTALTSHLGDICVTHLSPPPPPPHTHNPEPPTVPSPERRWPCLHA
ncbi:hypothetical protein Q8A73_019423 [Channa argus]|nr:hypothetical protein Q8A73_019423 [Channa argus]